MQRTIFFTFLLISFGSGAGCATAEVDEGGRGKDAATAEAALVRREYARSVMGGAARITFFVADEEAALAAAKGVFDLLEAIENALSDYRPAAELMQVNRGAGGPPLVVGDHLLAALAAARALAEATDGRFDPTIGPAVALWRRARREGLLPSTEESAAALALVDWRDLRLEGEDRTARLLRPGMALDLGGFGKGYAAHEALKFLAAQGIPRALVGLGGDYAAGDPPPGAEGWKIGFADGAAPLVLKNACVSTSGADEQFVEIDGRRYSHIVDPRTGVGLPPGPRMTVVAKDGGTADALATAASVAGPAAARELVRRFHGVRLWIDGRE